MSSDNATSFRKISVAAVKHRSQRQQRTRDTIRSGDNDIAVSVATFWELAVKQQLSRIDIDLGALQSATAADGFAQFAVEIAHTLRLQSLPDVHRDPFDRLLVAQAIETGSRLMMHDEQILAYAGHDGFEPLRV